MVFMKCSPETNEDIIIKLLKIIHHQNGSFLTEEDCIVIKEAERIVGHKILYHPPKKEK